MLFCKIVLGYIFYLSFQLWVKALVFSLHLFIDLAVLPFYCILWGGSAARFFRIYAFILTSLFPPVLVLSFVFIHISAHRIEVLTLMRNQLIELRRPNKIRTIFFIFYGVRFLFVFIIDSFAVPTGLLKLFDQLGHKFEIVLGLPRSLWSGKPFPYHFVLHFS